MPTLESYSDSTAKLFYDNIIIKVTLHSHNQITLKSDKDLTIITAQRHIIISLELANGIQSRYNFNFLIFYYSID